MSIQREVEISIGNEDLSKIPRSELKARLARVFDRSMSFDKLRVDLPPELYGEWIPSDHQSMREAELKGFRLDETYAPQQTSFKSNRHVDAVYMIMPKIVKELADEIELDNYNKRHNPTKQIEDNHTGPSAEAIGLPVYSVDTNVSNVSGEGISSALQGV